MRIAALIVLFLIVIGFSPRFTCIFHCWITSSFLLASSAVDGGDQIASNLSLLILPICLMDNRKWHWAKSIAADTPLIKNMAAYFVFGLVRLQIAIIYFHSAVGKLDVEEWVNGTATYYWLNNTFFRMPKWSEPVLMPILSHSFGVTIMSYGAIILELSLFLCLFASERLKKYMLTFGILFHFSILILHGLVSFFFSISAGLILYLYPVSKAIDFKNIFKN